MDTKVFTYQTRISTTVAEDNFLSDYAALYGKVERSLFADMCRGNNIIKLKSPYLTKFGITARQFNAVRIVLQGKVDSVKSRQQEYIDAAANRIKKIKSKIKYLSKIEGKTAKQFNNLHQQQRALRATEYKLDKLTADKQQGKVRLCFGSKKIFKQQFNLAKNNYSSHDEWKQSWTSKRDSQFYTIGSKDETAGNQSCVALLNDSSYNTIDLKIRVPDCLKDKHGTHVSLSRVSFKYGFDTIHAAIKSNLKRNQLASKAQRVLHKDLYKSYGQAISYRFKKDAKGWVVFVTVEMQPQPQQSFKELGAIGVDINANHLAVAEIGSDGNYLNSFSVATNTYGKSTEQAKAIIGDAIKVIVNYAVVKSKPIVLEKLDFANKKRDMRHGTRHKRMLSSFAYSAIISMIKARAFRFGVDVIQVNPAYSSVIGRVKFAPIYNISTHKAAALVIARRLFGFSEQLPHCWKNIPDNNGHHVTLPQLAKIAGKHVWSSWAVVQKNLKTVLAVQSQMYRRARMLEPPTMDDTIPF